MAKKKKSVGKKSKPAKRLTWWHPLFGGIIEFSGQDAFQVISEEEVGQLPMLIDIIILLRDPAKPLPDWTFNAAPSLFGRLNDVTIIEFKGPTDALQDGDFALSLARALTWTAQQNKKRSASKVTFIFVAPKITKAIKDEISRLNGLLHEDERGIYKVSGISPFETWMIESSEGWNRGEALLSLVSPQILKSPHELFDKLSESPYANLLGFCFRQIKQFKSNEKEFRLKYEELKTMDTLLEEVADEILENLSPDKQEKYLEGLPLEKRLEGLSPEERIEGLSPEERIEGLSPEERAKLLRLLSVQDQSEKENN